jgi:hypothetical protein
MLRAEKKGIKEEEGKQKRQVRLAKKKKQKQRRVGDVFMMSLSRVFE